MTIEQYNRIAELAKEGKTGIEIVSTINAESKSKEEGNDANEGKEESKEGNEGKEESKEGKEEDKQKDKQEAELFSRLDNLQKQLTTMQETFHAVNIMNSSQPDTTEGSADILAKVFAGYTDGHKGE